VSRRTTAIGAVVVLVALPAILALIEAVTFFLRNRNNGSIVSSGQRREYLLYVPMSYDRTRPAPLVISMHGAAGWPVQQMELSGWNRLAESEGFLVVYPSGIESAGPRIWHVDSGGGLGRDVTFIAELIDKLEADYNIDRSRIYANGFSNGGGMSFALSCTLSNRIAAVGMVGAAQTLPWRWCTDHRAVPMISFHGTADRMAPYHGGSSWVSERPFPDVATWATNWARRNRCGPQPIESAVAADVARREYTNCADDASVVLYTIERGGHTWPGGKPLPEWFVGPTSRSIDATRQMWAFFRAHPLPRKSQARASFDSSPAHRWPGTCSPSVDAVGTVKKKVVPTEILLSTQIRPPCSSTIPLTIGSPNPAPCR
jgi:polyhydroxybutyrate depolymerase